MRHIVPSRQQKQILLTCCAGLLGLILGCGGGGGLPEGETGTVSGKVTFEGKSVPEGTSIIFIHKEKGITASGTIASDGSYTLHMRGGTDILIGPYQIGVTPPTVEMTPAEQEAVNLSGKPMPEKEWPNIPKKYRIPEKSGESFDVQAGSNSYDLDMKG